MFAYEYIRTLGCLVNKYNRELNDEISFVSLHLYISNLVGLCQCELEPHRITNSHYK